MPLTALNALADVDDVQLVSLQRDHQTEPAAPMATALIDHSAELRTWPTWSP